MKSTVFALLFFWIFGLYICGQSIHGVHLQSRNLKTFEKGEWDIKLAANVKNPYDAGEIRLDMLLTAPNGTELVLPCYFERAIDSISLWKARFAPKDTGEYSYFFRLNTKGKTENSNKETFTVRSSHKPGFLHPNDYWTFRFDDGTLFRGIGENVAWESRTWENPKYTYEYLLGSLSKSGANFFRTWMCAWNLPLEWKKINNSNRYKSSDAYFNPDAIEKMDKLVTLSDSLGLYMMLTLDWHGELIANAEWRNSSYNKANGGPAATPAEFFTSEAAQNQYKNKLRYIIARWGYSTSIAAWEFFNEIDNAAFTSGDSIIIPHAAITQWHDEMSMYLKNTDPYQHMVTTSISHRDILGLNSLANIDFNQKHIYKHTDKLAPTIKTYSQLYSKPYNIGEFGYEWDWNVDFRTIRKELSYDYRRGLWYGLFCPTPVLPMSWWWEFFDEEGMTPYFRSVREISDQMLAAGKGSFREVEVKAGLLEAYGLQCGDKIFVYLLNNTTALVKANVELKLKTAGALVTKGFVPSSRKYKDAGKTVSSGSSTLLKDVTLNPKEELILIFNWKER